MTTYRTFSIQQSCAGYDVIAEGNPRRKIGPNFKNQIDAQDWIDAMLESGELDEHDSALAESEPQQ